MKRRLTLAALALVTMVTSSMISSGCAYRRAYRSLVQPLALEKKQLNGEWLYQKTVYDAPYEATMEGTTSLFAGAGAYGEGAKIRFEVTERFLFAFNASPNVRNTDSAVSPVAAWPISRHFDIKPRLNFSTGEPSNVIVEESSDGLPWYQRKYMRVHWESSVIADFSDVFKTYYQWIGMMRVRPVTYVPPENFQVAPDNMSFVTEDIVESLYNSAFRMIIYEIPASAQRVKTRHFFRKIGPSSYVPKEYNDYMMNKFGVFRTTVVRFHPERGLVDWSYKLYANRHNIASKADLDSYAANNTPAADQKPRKIIYYLSPAFPADLVDSMKRVEAGWNKSFQLATGRNDRTFEVRFNYWDDSLAECGENGSISEITDAQAQQCEGKSKMRRELGDIRFNYIWLSDVPLAFGLLGYGPSITDPDTGEIYHGAAYVYTAAYRRIIDTYMTYYDMITGRFTESDITNGAEYFAAVDRLRGFNAMIGLNTESKQNYVQPFEGTKLGLTTQELRSRVLSSGFFSKMQELRKLDSSMIHANLARIDEDPRLKSMLMSDHFVELAAHGTSMDPKAMLASQDPDVRARLNSYNPTEMMRPMSAQLMDDEMWRPSRHNMYMELYADDSVRKFVEYHVAQKTPRDQIRKRLMEILITSVTAHEVGHTLGLMHNFKASTDEFNFPNAYWELKNDPNAKPAQCGASDCPADLNHIDFYRNASVMDYAGELHNDQLGVGKTDEAAIAFIYGGVVERSVQDPRQRGEMIPWNLEVDRKNMDPNDTLKLRHFRYCSDYNVGQDAFCMRRDTGTTATEIVRYLIESYDRQYLLRYWRRGRRAYGPWNAVPGSIMAYQNMAIIYQDFVNRLITQPDYRQTKDFEDKLNAVREAFLFLVRVIATPDVGQYLEDKLTRVYTRMSSRPLDYTGEVVNVPLGTGRYMFARLQEGYYGISDQRYRRVGFFIDKYYAMLMLAVRQMGFRNNNVNWVFTNFYDLFRDDSIDWFVQGISGVWDKDSTLLFRHTQNNKQLPLAPAWHPVLQQIGMFVALGWLNNVITDSTFSEYMQVGIKGHGSGWTAPSGSRTVSFTNYRGTREYFAVQSRDGRSISWRMVERAKALAGELELLRCCTPNVTRAEIERKEGELDMVETNLTIMKWYNSLFDGQ